MSLALAMFLFLAGAFLLGGIGRFLGLIFGGWAEFVFDVALFVGYAAAARYFSVAEPIYCYCLLGGMGAQAQGIVRDYRRGRHRRPAES